MKINVLFNKNGPPTEADFIEVDVVGRLNADISNEVDNNEAEEVRAMDVLPHFPFKDTVLVLENLLKKLKHGGRLTVGFTNIHAVVHNINFTNLSAKDINECLYGENISRLSVHSIKELVDFFRSKGLKILKARHTTPEVLGLIEVERP